MLRRVLLIGATASGKGEVAHLLARSMEAEIISLDSMKVFRGMDIGTAKPSGERRREVPYHLIDVVEPWGSFSVGDYVRLALEAVEAIEARGRRVLFAGGTGLYLRALVEGLFDGPSGDPSLRERLAGEIAREGAPAVWERLRAEDPDAAARIHPRDARRIVRALELRARTGERIGDLWKASSLRLAPGTYAIFGLAWPRPALYARIDARTRRFFERGLIDEVRRLASDPRGLGREASQAIGYKEVLQGLREGAPPDAIRANVQRETRRLAKRQLTWFRKFPVTWLSAQESRPEALAEAIARRWAESDASSPADGLSSPGT
ncbi:MAG: tRNA (adenosine(37)-N6)-dimethylallyltransferase MiaA [Planctomycetes bacterium]|nr:tRNA (adenosine(37)-N6)-dimethylallyltransferase MiaA [Planctomycetota bacterium]